MDYDKYYPDEAMQKEWLCRYLKAYNGGREATPDEVHSMYVLVNKFALCANLMWAVWALVQAGFSEIEFDFFDYYRQRINEYKKRKQEFLALK